MATVLARKGHNVCIVVRNEEQCKSINENHRNNRYLKDYVLLDNIFATTSPEEALAGCELIVHAIPVQNSFKFLSDIKAFIPADAPIVSVSKGITIDKLELMCEVFPDALGHDHPVAYLSGPSFAKEVMDKSPTAVVIAAKDEAVAKKVQKFFLSLDFRCYVSTDVTGVEVGGAMKNVLAIAAGAVLGMGMGSNTLAALVTRGCSEIAKLAKVMGAKPFTLAGLAGIGDLMLTCFGGLSRNLNVGKKLGEGMSLEEVLAGMKEVAEGVYTARATRRLLAKHNLELPILLAVADVVEGVKHTRQALLDLFALPLTTEFDDQLFS
jgi:glycerol-3-phosphate dehydrogenase (NAD+)